MPRVQRQSGQTVWDKIWKDKTGKVVIYQHPNRYLIAWVVLTLISLFTNGHVSDIFGYLGNIALAIWSVLEIWKGVNYFRRALGVGVLLFIIAGLFKVGM